MRILFVNNNMHIGGVQKALLNLVCELHQRHDVTLLLLYRGGELLDRIPGDVEVLEASSPLRFWGMSKFDVHDASELMGRSAWAGLTRLLGRGASCRLAGLFERDLGTFDVAVSYLHSGNPKAFYGGCAEYVLSCAKAPTKICFMHNDYRQIRATSAYNKRLYSSFDAIAACSNGCRDAFLEVAPQLEGKTAVVRNCVGYAEARRLAAADVVSLPTGRLNVLTVARLGREKGVLRAIRAVASLVESGHPVTYHVAGSGVELGAARELVKELGVGNSVVLHGELGNPYPLMAACDLLLIPSYAEAAPLVVGEAACLGTPVLSTKTSSAVEMVEDAGYGWVCDNTDEGILSSLASLAQDPDLLEERSAALRGMAFDDGIAIAQFEKLISGGVGL